MDYQLSYHLVGPLVDLFSAARPLWLSWCSIFNWLISLWCKDLVFPAWRAHLLIFLKQIQTAMLEMTPLSCWRSFPSFPNSYPLNPPVLRSPLPPILYPAVPGHPHMDTLKPVCLVPLRCHIVPLVIPTFPSVLF